jgi:hypothetical protein
LPIVREQFLDDHILHWYTLSNHLQYNG